MTNETMRKVIGCQSQTSTNLPVCDYDHRLTEENVAVEGKDATDFRRNTINDAARRCDMERKAEKMMIKVRFKPYS